MLTRLFWIWVGAVLLFGGMGTGCRHDPNSPSSERVLSVHLLNEPVTLDPGLIEDGVSLQVVRNLDEGLMGYDSSGRLGLRLAEGYEVSPDGKRYFFRLKKGLRWSDGHPLQVEDFVFAFKRLLGPGGRSPFASVFSSIRGAKSLLSIGATFGASFGVFEKEGGLVIELDRPMPALLHALTLPIAFPIRKDVLDANHGDWPDTGPVTGPYRIVSRQREEKIRLSRNPLYWGQAPRISEIEFKVITDETTAYRLFASGRLDILSRISSFDLPRVRQSQQLETYPFWGVYFLSFNTAKPPFQDRRWRRAVAGAVQRNEVVTVVGGGESPASSFVPKGIEGFFQSGSPTAEFEEDVQWAKSQKVFSEVNGTFDAGLRNSRVMEKVQADLKQRLGLSLVLRSLDWKSYLRSLSSDPSALYRMGYLVPYQDPVFILKIFTTGHEANHTGWSDPRYDRWVDEISMMKPGPEREAKVIRAQKLLLSEGIVVPLFHYVQNIGVSKRVKEARSNTTGVILFQEMEWKDQARD